MNLLGARLVPMCCVDAATSLEACIATGSVLSALSSARIGYSLGIVCPACLDAPSSERAPISARSGSSSKYSRQLVVALRDLQVSDNRIAVRCNLVDFGDSR